jgi:hypothetical protein
MPGKSLVVKGHASVVQFFGPGKKVLITKDADIGMAVQNIDHGSEPARGYLGVIIEKTQKFTLSQESGPVVVDAEVHTLFVSDYPCEGVKSQVQRFVTGVIDQDDFIRYPGSILDHGLKTCPGKLWPIMKGNDN